MKEDRYVIRIFLIILALVFALSLIITIFYFEKLNCLTDLSNSKSVGMFINSLVAFGTISLALATFVSLYFSQMKEDKEKKKLLNIFNFEHLNDIKKNLLRPILTKINDTYPAKLFGIKDFQMIDKTFLNGIILGEYKPYNKELVFHESYNNIVRNNLYIDLQNHKITKDIPKDFDDILKLIVEKYPLYVNNLISLFKKISSLSEFELIKKKFLLNKKYNSDSSLNSAMDDYCKLIVIMSLGYQDLNVQFSDLYNLVDRDGEIENIKKISHDLKNSDEVRLIKTIKSEVGERVDVINKKIIEILKDNTLILDECDYLRQKRIIYQI